MKKSPVVMEILGIIVKLYDEENDVLWTKYRESIDVLSKNDLTTILQAAVEKYERLFWKPTRYKGSLETLLNLITSLIENGADVNNRFEPVLPGGFIDSLPGSFTYGTYLLSSTKSPELVRLLLKHGANPNVVGGWRTPLANVEFMSPSLTNNLELVDHSNLVKLMLKAGADPNLKDEEGRSALSHLTNPKALRMLIKAGANIESRDNLGRTPIMIEGSGGPLFNQLKTLLEAGANSNAEDHNGRAALSYVQQPESAKILKRFGADFAHKDKEGKTALFHVLEQVAFQDTIEVLITEGVPINEVDKSGNCSLTPRFWCPSVIGGFIDNLEVLLRHGALPDIPNNEGITPLMYWAGYTEVKECRKILEILISSGADKSKVDKMGLNAMDHAVINSNTKTVISLLKKKRNPKSL